MAKPLLVNVSGMRRVGVTSACDRVARSLNAMGFETIVVSLDSAREVMAFDDEIVLNGAGGVDIVIFDKHFYTETAARRGLKTAIWNDDDPTPDLSILMTPNHSPNDRHKDYLKLAQAHYGTDNHFVINTSTHDGKLYAAGNIRALILREIRRA